MALRGVTTVPLSSVTSLVVDKGAVSTTEAGTRPAIGVPAKTCHLIAASWRVKVTVGDNGPGIPESEREAIFEPFYRLDPSRSTGTGGSGPAARLPSPTCVILTSRPRAMDKECRRRPFPNEHTDRA